MVTVTKILESTLRAYLRYSITIFFILNKSEMCFDISQRE